MSSSRPTPIQAAVELLTSTRLRALPPQHRLRDRVRAALAFQPTRPLDPDIPERRANAFGATTAPIVPDARVRTFPEELEGEISIRGARRSIMNLSVATRLRVRRHWIISALSASAELSEILADGSSELDLESANRARHIASSLTGWLGHAPGAHRADIAKYRAKADAITLSREKLQTLISEAARLAVDFRTQPEARRQARASALQYSRDFARVEKKLEEVLAHLRELEQYEEAEGSTEPSSESYFILETPRAYDLANRIERQLNGLDHGQAREERADYLARDLSRVLESAAARLLGLSYMASRDLSAALLGGVLDDFTTANFSETDLRGIDLEGVHWSVWGTVWPDTIDVDQLRDDSREVDEGSGIYEIQGGQQRAFLSSPL